MLQRGKGPIKIWGSRPTVGVLSQFSGRSTPVTRTTDLCSSAELLHFIHAKLIKFLDNHLSSRQRGDVYHSQCKNRLPHLCEAKRTSEVPYPRELCKFVATKKKKKKKQLHLLAFRSCQLFKAPSLSFDATCHALKPALPHFRPRDFNYTVNSPCGGSDRVLGAVITGPTQLLLYVWK